MLIQNIAGDDARGDTQDAWERVEALFSTLGEDELVDPATPPETLLFRLFHEEGVRLFAPLALRAFCRCSEERVMQMLRTFPEEDRRDMAEDDGHIRVTCEYCSRTFSLEPAEVAGA